MKKTSAIIAVPFAILLLTAEKCDPGGAGGSSGGLVTSACESARDNADAWNKIALKHPTKNNKRLSRQADQHAIDVCTTEGKKIRKHHK